MTKHKDKILELRKQGLSYRDIQNKLGCSKSTICYHLGEGQKEKYLNRERKRKKKLHPFKRKIEFFLSRKQRTKIQINKSNSSKKLLVSKIRTFHTKNKKMGYKMSDLNFTVEDVINKFSENPKCYLTGKLIDLDKPRTYQFDHVIPTAKGGDNTLDNLQIATKEANMGKSDLTLEQFIQLCKDVLVNFGYEVKK